MANKPPQAPEPKKNEPDLSRQELIFGTGAGGAEVVVGEGVGYALPKQKGPSLAIPEVWLGGNRGGSSPPTSLHARG